MRDDQPQNIRELVKRIITYPFRMGWHGTVVAVLIITFMIGAGLSAIADSAKPGDALFFLDRGFEKLRIVTSFSDTSRFKHKVAIGQERLSELQEFDLDDTNKLLKSLDEFENALKDVKSETANVDELTEAQDSANQVIDNLLDLVARYRAFLLGETEGTEDIQQELDDSVDDINKIVNVTQQVNPTSSAQPVQTQTTTSNLEAGDDSGDIEAEQENEDCKTEYQNLGQEVEREGVTLNKNDCGEYTVKFNGITYILITNENLDYALNRSVKYHGEAGTNKSIFLTEFELDN